MEFKAHDYQKVAIDWIIENPKCGLFLDMGLGKTITTYTALDILINDYFDVGKALVIAPKRVAESTWPDEYDKWSHLKDLTIAKVIGTPKERLAALEEKADIYIITRDNVVWLVDLLGSDWDFDTIVIDELSSFKNHQSKRFKALRKVSPFFERVIGLTGTPAPNGYQDLWSQIYLMDRGERLGKNITEFRRRYFNAYHRGMYTEYELKEGGKEQIDEAIADICISMKAKDYLDLKEPMFIDVPVEMSAKEYKIYKEMEMEAIIELRDEEITALSAAAVSNKLMQMANGSIYGDDGQDHLLHCRKLEALEGLMEEAQGESVLVFYNFKSDLGYILKNFDYAVKLEGDEDIRAWNNGEIKMLVAHPASAGHGLNLQDGGSIIIWYGLTWSLENYLQANARLQRQGQANTVRVYRLLTKDTIDIQVKEALEGKNIRQEELLAKLKAEILGRDD